MHRNRSAGIVIRDGKILLMHRINKGDEYWSFPGGGQEDDEDPQDTAVREIQEETTVVVTADRLVYHITWDTGEDYFFYLCTYVSGEPHLSIESEEYQYAQHNEQVYEPMWVPLEEVATLRLYQLEVRDLLLEDCAQGFKDIPQELSIVFSERRHQ